jgi:serine/threonine protein kinase
MSTFISEPGTRLGGRYRLEDRVSASTGWSAWKAIDETLARAVTVLTFAPGFPRIAEVVTAARAASRLTDARVAQVFDVEEDWDHAYVVMEWVSGESLDDLLSDGPLEAGLSTEIVEQGAEALASAHAAGVAHLCLNPRSLRWTAQGGVKIVGLGIDAALAGVTAEDPALADTYGLAKLLYAALTAHWPGDDWPALPPAPEVDGHPFSPRQVRAGVPAGVDEVACQALFQRAPADGQPISTPAALAAALTRVMPAAPAPPPPRPFTQQSLPSAPGQPTSYWEGDGEPDWRGAPPRELRPARQGGKAPRALIAAVVLLVVAGIALGAFVLSHNSGGTSGGSAQASHHPSTGSQPEGLLNPAGAQGFDALSTPAQDSSNENSNKAHFAIDGNPRTAWPTQWYASPRFGNLKAGTGLILDMGKLVRLSSVTLTLGPTPGANVHIELGNQNARSPATLHSFTTVAQASNVGGTHKFTVSSKATGRYVLIWFTKLPPNSAGQFEAEVFNVTLRGAS